ncbi:MFS transporter [Alcaligenes pakistanensis]|uniref:MFS transporter n=1 Tax=Alcaligenes pakistanensis TaxID=1482717 RepID=A0A8H9IND9_9BURK|nr:MFS transporter [Alcaligenes pakistanensis]MBP6622046.1 MFS transporter [Alcaligenes sp.]GHC54402.1 MFS transporter [Alcaligenes pakistanensis]HCA16941.1 MFS transporter [Alcaligenes faecalis]
MSKKQSPQDGAPVSPWRAASAAGLGTMIEYYDFQLYGVLAVTLSVLFFQTGNENAALLSTLAVFGGAFLARPLGGIFFGWFGDKHGRTAALMFTIVGIGIASALMGMLPTYATLGLAAPALLLLCRLLQGFFAGGEITGAATYVAECSPPGKRGFFGAFNPAAATLGLSLATGVAGLVTTLVGKEAMVDWGWRIPFLLSIPLIILCVWARSRIEDSPRFKEMLKTHRPEHSPLSLIVRNYRRPLLQVIAIGFAQNAAGYVGVVYLSTHLIHTLKYDGTAVFWLISLVTLCSAFVMPFAGSLSDRFGRKPLLTIGFLGYLVLVPLTMWVASWGSFPLAVMAVAVSIVPFIVVQAVGYPLYAELFPTRVRYSGVSLGFNVATILGGATAPFVASWLTSLTGSSMAPAFYVMAAALVGIVALSTVQETSGRQLAD